MNAITPLKASFALIVTFAQKYQKDAGVGTVVALLLPYVAIIFVGGRSFWPRGTSSDFPGARLAWVRSLRSHPVTSIRLPTPARSPRAPSRTRGAQPDTDRWRRPRPPVTGGRPSAWPCA